MSAEKRNSDAGKGNRKTYGNIISTNIQLNVKLIVDSARLTYRHVYTTVAHTYMYRDRVSYILDYHLNEKIWVLPKSALLRSYHSAQGCCIIYWKAFFIYHYYLLLVLVKRKYFPCWDSFPPMGFFLSSFSTA